MQDKRSWSVIFETANEEGTPEIKIEESFPKMIEETKTLFDPEIILVDCSDDGMHKHWTDKFPQVKYVFAPGASYFDCKNIGAEHATKDWLLFLDSDCRLPEGWVEKFKEIIKRPEIDVISGITKYPEHILGKTLTLVDFYPPNKYMKAKRFNLNNFAISRELYLKYKFPKTLLKTRGANSLIQNKMYREGVRIYQTPELTQTHNYYPNWMERRFRSGYDSTNIRELDPEFPQSKIYKKAKWVFPLLWAPAAFLKDCARALRVRKDLKIRLWELPAVVTILGATRACDMLGMYWSYINPKWFEKTYGKTIDVAVRKQAQEKPQSL